MEILYIWFKDYRVFKDQGINLSDKYIFEKETDKDGTILISIKENKDYIPNFFDENGSISVSALIGQNGMGKSTVLEFIRDNLVEGSGNIYIENIVIVNGFNDYQEKEKEQFIALHSKNIFVRVAEKPKYVECSDLVYDDMITKRFNKSTIIYYSNIFDNKSESDLTGLENISTNFLLKSDVEHYPNDPDLNLSELEIYRKAEIYRNINFIQKNKIDNLPFNLPESLLIYFNEYDASSLTGREKKWKPIFDELSALKSDKKDSKNLFIDNIFISVFFNFVRNYSVSQISKDYKSFIQSTKKEKDLRKRIIQFFKIEYDRKVLSDNSGAIIKFLRFIVPFVERYYSKHYSCISIPIKNDDINNLDEFFKYYLPTVRITTYLDFDWRDLSSGEKSYLTLFSRFYSIVDRDIKGREPLKDSLIILIDECDINFHPEWQRTVFNELLKYLIKIFPNKEIQIINASNSPFITSDIPKYCTVFFEKSENDKLLVLPKDNNRDETFGANIHSLLSNSFYLKRKIGDFAYNKIDGLIKYLGEEDINLSKKDSMRNIMNIIGEPIIKMKVEEKWIEKFGKEEEIKILEKRLAKLKNKRNDKN